MKLTIKTLQQMQFKIDIEDDKTVKELKDKIEADHGKDYPTGFQKLIYAGKILADECKLSEYNIDEKKFIVLMITRPPPPPKVQAETKSTTAPSAVKKEDKPKTEEKPKTESTTSATTSTTNTNTNTNNNPTTTPTTTTTTTATSLQQNNQQAADRLLSGLGRTSNNDLDQPHMASRLAAMMQQPHFRQIQDSIQQSPHLLSSTIESLAGTDPEMYHFISHNPDVFVNALNHPPMAGSRGSLSSRSSTTGGGGGGVSTEQSSQPSVRTTSGGRQQPVVDQILPNVSERDKEAIERLKELGFSEIQAVQAYIACDKDEQLAANLLFQMEQ